MIETRSREGRFEARYLPDVGGLAGRVVRGPVGGIGLVLLAAPMAIVRPEAGLAFASMLALQFILFLGGLKLLAEASRRGRIASVLHVGAGELEVTAGRRPLSITRALGPVETDCILLVRGAGRLRDRFSVRAVAANGAAVDLAIRDRDEKAALDLALVVSQGLSVPMVDRRYAPAPPVGGESEPPARVTTSGDGSRRVLTWEYRDRLRPRAALLALGAVVLLLTVLSTPLPLAEVLVLSAATVLVSLGLLAHLVSALTVRRVTLRPDGVRVERTLAAVPLLQRLTLFEELAGVLVFRRGPLATVHFRNSDRRGPVLPFEDPGLAGWLKQTVERAAHASMQKDPPPAARPASPG